MERKKEIELNWKKEREINRKKLKTGFHDRAYYLYLPLVHGTDASLVLMAQRSNVLRTLRRAFQPILLDIRQRNPVRSLLSLVAYHGLNASISLAHGLERFNRICMQYDSACATFPCCHVTH